MFTTQEVYLCFTKQLRLENHSDFNMYMIRPRGYNLFSCSAEQSMNFIMLINVKVPTILGILTFISMTNITFESLKARIRGLLYVC